MTGHRRVLLLLTLAAFLLSAARAEERPLVLYFYDNYCSACNLEQEFIERFQALTGQQITDYDAELYDAYSAAGQAALARAAETYSLSSSQLQIPLLIVDGAVYSGTRAIEERLPYDFLVQSNSDESRIYYLYSPACADCADASAILDRLEPEIRVTVGGYAFDSPLAVEEIDITDQPWLAQALFDQYGIPEESRKTPMIFIGDTALYGNRIRESAVRLRLNRGDGLHTPTVTEARASSQSLIETIAAGLAAGLNPCALSMLLLFLSMLISGRGRVAASAAGFLIGKGLTYLLIGVCFLALFQAWNPTWLPGVSRILMTAVCAVSAGLNLWDAVMLHKGQGGAVRNQLPTSMRRRLHQYIRRTSAGAVVPIAAGLLGCVVAAGEFLCAGQLYLAVLLKNLQGSDFARSLGMLAVYCLSFLAPSAALCVAVLRGRKVLALSAALSSREALIKLITALVMIALAVLTWLM